MWRTEAQCEYVYVCADLEVHGCLRRDKGDHGCLVLAIHGAVQGGLATGVLWARHREDTESERG